MFSNQRNEGRDLTEIVTVTIGFIVLLIITLCAISSVEKDTNIPFHLENINEFYSEDDSNYITYSYNDKEYIIKVESNRDWLILLRLYEDLYYFGNNTSICNFNFSIKENSNNIYLLK